MSIFSKLSKTTKSILFATGLLGAVTLAVFGPHWSDNADKSFWWTFWDVMCGVGIAGFIGGIWWYITSKKQN